MKRTFVRFISVFIVLVLALSLNVTATTADTNVTWAEYDSVLYIEGTGDMVIDYEFVTEIPWYNLRKQITKIVIGEGITSIYEGAFIDFVELREVVLPSSLRVIGTSAFMTCTSLKEITLPYKITRIEGGAFCNCSSLERIVIPGSIVQISDDAFYDSTRVNIVGVDNTYAHDYAKLHGINFLPELGPSAEILVRVNDSYVDFDQAPVIINDRTMVPMRKIFEAMGIEVDWDPATRTVSALRGNVSISLVVDTNVIRQTVNGNTKDIIIDVPAQIVGDRTMVPTRAIVESFMASVNWDGKTRTVLVQD